MRHRARLVATFGDVPLTRLNNVAIMLTVSCCLANLLLIVMLSFYITAVDRSFRHSELLHFPLFGLPLVAVAISVVCLLIWKIANCFLQLPAGFGYLALAVTSGCLARTDRTANLNHSHLPLTHTFPYTLHHPPPISTRARPADGRADSRVRFLI